ncbi:MAG: hypothetical protein CBB71_07415 [Rhodopirellula sp. TMED11]|nr:MAG: hypothetical protein CBB71_07415 [Rhodopirellula sp. TMED11]
MRNFLDIPQAGSRPGMSPGAGLAAGIGGAAAGGAAADFLQNRDASPGQMPARPGTGERPGTADRGDLANRRDPEARPGDRRDQVSNNREDRSSNRGDRTENRGDRTNDRQDRREQFSDNQAGRIENRGEWQQNREERRDYVNDYMNRYPLRGDFWRENPAWGRWAITRPYRWASWAAVTSWFPWGWSQPVSYSYGNNVYYEGDQVYYGDQVYASADEYADQASQIATSAPEAQDNEEWLTLGVFAVTQDGETSGPPPTMFVQLAVSKTGIIAGTFYNQSTDKSVEIEGAVDQKSQRAAWVGKGQERPLMETGINNLTEDAAPALIHFEDGQTEQVLLVRLEDPEGESQQ